MIADRLKPPLPMRKVLGKGCLRKSSYYESRMKRAVTDSVLGIVLAVVGVAVLTSNVPELFSNLGVLLRSSTASGIIRDCVRVERGDQAFDRFASVFEFTTADGQRITATTTPSSAPCVDAAHYRQTIVVHYDAQQPNTALAGSAFDLLARPVLLTVLAIGALGLAVLGTRESVQTYLVSIKKRHNS